MEDDIIVWDEAVERELKHKRISRDKELQLRE